jgi:glycosyltransferase involved in cell wall biosynthesis
MDGVAVAGGDGGLRVLVACDWFLKYSASQAKALRRTGADVTLLCRDHAHEFGGSTQERDDVIGALRDEVAVSVLPGRVKSPSAVKHVVALRREVRGWRPDIVHTHDNADPRLLAIVAGLTRVTTLHDPVPHPGQPRMSRVEQVVRRRWITGSAAVVLHGKALADVLPDWVPRARVAFIPHGTSVREDPLPAPARPCVLLFGRLEPYKGIDVLLRAMKRVWAVRREVKLLVAGSGPEASLVPTDPRIELRSQYIREAELDALFREASVAVLPYVEGSQSGVGAQALGRGVPTIVSDVGALADIALDPSFLVLPGDDEALARSILRHLDDGHEVRRAALAFAGERLSWDACARQALALYKSLLSKDRR